MKLFLVWLSSTSSLAKFYPFSHLCPQIRIDISDLFPITYHDIAPCMETYSEKEYTWPFLSENKHRWPTC